MRLSCICQFSLPSPNAPSELSEVLWQQLLHFGYSLALPAGLEPVVQTVVVFGAFAGWAGMDYRMFCVFYAF